MGTAFRVHTTVETSRSVRRRSLIISLFTVMILGSWSVAAGAEKAVRSDGVFTEGVGGGTAQIVRTDSGIDVQVTSTGLTPGNAYTVWFIVSESDNPPLVVNAAGNIVGKSGTSGFAGHLSTGDVGAVNGTDVLADGGDGSFDDPRGALVMLHVVDHGPAGVDGPGTIPENIHEITGSDGFAQEWVFAP